MCMLVQDLRTSSQQGPSQQQITSAFVPGKSDVGAFVSHLSAFVFVFLGAAALVGRVVLAVL